MHAIYSQTQNNTTTKTNLSTVKWAQWNKTKSRELLGLIICACSSLCTIVAHNSAQNRLDIFPLALQTITIAPMMSIWGKGGCGAVTLSRRETRWNLQECPKLGNGSQPLVGRRSPYCKDVWGRHCCLTSFFPIVDMCLRCEDIARQNCAMVPRWQLFGDFLGRAFPASRAQHISDMCMSAVQ